MFNEVRRIEALLKHMDCKLDWIVCKLSTPDDSEALATLTADLKASSDALAAAVAANQPK